jgi:hypothetical protein
MLGSSGMPLRPPSPSPRLALALAGFVACTVAARKAHADATDRFVQGAKGEARNPLRTSTLIFDQSMTTQTASLGSTPQSYVPLYELWFSLRPRYWFDEHWAIKGRFDYAKELTNNQSTTYRDEDVFGDIWTDFAYQTKLDALWEGTTASLGARALWPTSKGSQANGTYVTLGALGSASHTFSIRGEDAPWLNNAHVGLIASGVHPFTTATTATSYGGFVRARQNVDGFSFMSDQLQGQTLDSFRAWVILDMGLQVTPKLSLLADFISINHWHYAPTGTAVSTATGPYAVPRINDEQFTQDSWLFLDVDYALVDELNLGIGYYNLANAIGPDGQRRGLFGANNIWWSPDARIFFDVTANLDAIFDDVSHHRYSNKESARRGRQDRVASELR